ncbi:Beta-galactoside-specific lectin 3 [Actinoplanes friuliensis]|jgi:hypothetical protein|uniref:Beta-galactoside-specific lectin 3 n=1 Tax=Actinoplanes friuliensis DSM 7358 TaxID=1246995 RepID=U5WF48_9ACTN|nr:Beta-galactoside-specific lectin 3 [Actinoplanes friuliensis]AGZ46655.1 Beta-galactoside-specific lectin 3 [Actinoplanes friuliensis DSM 7358]
MHAGVRTLAARWRRHRHSRRNDTGSMPLALLVTLVGVTLSAGMSGITIGQFKDTQRAADRVAAVNAAQAGLDAGLAQIRSVYKAVGNVPGDLKCLVPTVPVLNAASGGKSDYKISVGYFLTDPAGLVSKLAPIGDLNNITGLLTGGPSAVNNLLNTVTTTVNTVTAATGVTDALQSALGCVNGKLSQVPLYALLRAEGTSGTASRTLYATYTFHTTEDNIPGGRIQLYNNGGPKLCLGAGNAAPKPGDEVVAVACTSSDLRTKFIYPKNLSLVLEGTRAPSVTNAITGVLTGAKTYPYGLCVTATTFTNEAPVKLQECVTPKSPLQQWSYEVNEQTYYATTNGTSSNGYCLNAKTTAVNSPIVVRVNSGTATTNCKSTGNLMHNFSPDAAVGAGSAGINTGQLVNSKEVGRCLDLTNEDVTGAWFTSRKLAPALITYPCKQTFTSSVYWNHKWTAPTIPIGQYKVTGQIYTVPGSGTYAGKLYCLNSPGPAGGYVWVSACSGGGNALQWTLYDQAPKYQDSYQIVDQNGLCLMAAGSLGPAYLYSNTVWSEVITAKCDGGELQKWNVPAYVNPNPLKSMVEK